MASQKRKDTLTFHADWYRYIEKYPEEKRWSIMKAIMAYAYDGIEPDDEEMQLTVFLICQEIKREREAYEALCEKRREAGRKRWEELKKQKNKGKEGAADQGSTGGTAAAHGKKEGKKPGSPARKKAERKSAAPAPQAPVKASAAAVRTEKAPAEAGAARAATSVQAQAGTAPAAPGGKSAAEEQAERQFAAFHRDYPGTKEPYERALERFKARHPLDWIAIAPRLMPSLERYRAHLEAQRLTRRPDDPPMVCHLRTYMNERRWEMEYEQPAPPKDPPAREPEQPAAAAPPPPRPQPRPGKTERAGRRLQDMMAEALAAADRADSRHTPPGPE